MTFREWGITDMSMRLSAIMGSPSKCITPVFWRIIDSVSAFMVWILLFLSILFVNSWIARGGISMGRKGESMVISMSPSWIFACGAI